MSKWRIPRVPKSVARASTIVIGGAMAIVAALALPHDSSDSDCLLFQARLATREYPALELHLCALVPSTGDAVVVRYDVAIRIAIMPNRPR